LSTRAGPAKEVQFGSRASSETRQSVSVMSAFCTIRSETLPVILDAA
jgi:hypothetical protein